MPTRSRNSAKTRASTTRIFLPRESPDALARAEYISQRAVPSSVYRRKAIQAYVAAQKGCRRTLVVTTSAEIAEVATDLGCLTVPLRMYRGAEDIASSLVEGAGLFNGVYQLIRLPEIFDRDVYRFWAQRQWYALLEKGGIMCGVVTGKIMKASVRDALDRALPARGYGMPHVTRLAREFLPSWTPMSILEHAVPLVIDWRPRHRAQFIRECIGRELDARRFRRLLREEKERRKLRRMPQAVREALCA